jgi:hypothetical protein
MEKNTKILIGLGAVIAAYLILKPKKVTAEKLYTSTLEPKVQIDYAPRSNNKDYLTPWA